jgi:anterior pharynx defective protein 1
MPSTLFTACLFIAYGPASTFLTLVIAKSSHLLVLAICAAFFELVAFITTGLLYFIIPSEWQPGRDVLTAILGVFIHECARFLFILSYGKVEYGLIKASGLYTLPFPDLSSSLASGFGFGLMYALLKYGSVLGLTLGPGDWYLPSCPNVSMFIVSAFITLAMEILHVALMVIAFDTVRGGRLSPRSKLSTFGRTCTVLMLHLAVTCSTLANENANVGGCSLGVNFLYLWTAVSCLVAVWVIRASLSLVTS